MIFEKSNRRQREQTKMKDATVCISTVNGTGSFSANRMLSFIFFRCGFNPGGFHFFPSNIAGLPCRFILRLSSNGFAAFKEKADLLISLNPKTLPSDLKRLKPSGFLITEAGAEGLPPSFKGKRFSCSFRPDIQDCPAVIKKQLKNMVYVGLVSRFFNLNKNLSETAIRDFLSRGGKSDALIDWNLQAFKQGREPSKTPVSATPVKTAPVATAPVKTAPLKTVPAPPESGTTKTKRDPPSATGEETLIKFQLPPPENFPAEIDPLQKQPSKDAKNSALSSSSSLKAGDRIFMDGATAAALGALSAGCRLMSWYPITPASSVAESFEKFAACFFDEKTFSSVQAEDEIAAFSMALGAGWAGLRAAAVTSGPGLSLMAEGAGLAYFAETPLVLFNIQRAGPSTGLPTRTAQGDLLSSCFLSHGDTKHIVLLPGCAEECFSFAEAAFNLAEELQTLVIFLSDLDSALNPQAARAGAFSPGPFKRGRIKTEKDLDDSFERYKEIGGSGVSHRILPGTPHRKAGFLTRGSGHNEKAEYSEDPEDYKNILNKLKRKWERAASLMPKPLIIPAPSPLSQSKEKTAAKRGSLCNRKKKAFVTFGKNENACLEAMAVLKEEHGDFSYMRLRSFPFPKEAEDFLQNQEEVYVAEQNRDGQLKSLLLSELPFLKAKLHSVLKYTGEPFSAEDIVSQFKELNRAASKPPSEPLMPV